MIYGVVENPDSIGNVKRIVIVGKVHDWIKYTKEDMKKKYPKAKIDTIKTKDGDYTKLAGHSDYDLVIYEPDYSWDFVHNDITSLMM